MPAQVRGVAAADGGGGYGLRPTTSPLPPVLYSASAEQHFPSDGGFDYRPGTSGGGVGDGSYRSFFTPGVGAHEPQPPPQEGSRKKGTYYRFFLKECVARLRIHASGADCLADYLIAERRTDGPLRA